jgi:hypothetical protein
MPSVGPISRALSENISCPARAIRQVAMDYWLLES